MMNIVVTLCFSVVLWIAYIAWQFVCESAKTATTSEGLEPSKAPPTVPYSVPVVKSTFPFLFDSLRFFERAARHYHSHSTVRIALIHDDVYLVKSPKRVAEFFRNPSLIVTRAYGIALQHCFGMSQRAVDGYIADTSGSRSKPLSHSANMSESMRLSYHTHENLVKGLLGTGFGPAASRFETLLSKSLCQVGQRASMPCSSSSARPLLPPPTRQDGQEWTHGADLIAFTENHLGRSIVQALFGDLVLAQHSELMTDLWAFDKRVMSLAKRTPRIWNPEAYRLRAKLVGMVRQWHGTAQRLSQTWSLGPATGECRNLKPPKNETVDDEDDSDALWGTEMLRARYDMLIKMEAQDKDSVASTDFALMWATVTNVVPSSLNLILQLACNPGLMAEVRQSIAPTMLPFTNKTPTFDMTKVEKLPLLLSMYAETLRLNVQIHVPRSSPHSPITIGNTTIPPHKMIMANTWLAHTDEEVWNSQNGKHPLDTFWPRRFIVDPNDASSGPTKQRLPHDAGREEAYFSTEGLEGAWIPYGGGHHACPGRLLAKRIMLFSTVLVTTMFDIEILADDKALAYGSPRFGFGVRRPNGPIPFRIRRRSPLN